MKASKDLRVEVDGKDVGWKINPEVGADRYIYNMKINKRLRPGKHELSFTLLNKKLEGTAQLCNLEILEYGVAEEECVLLFRSLPLLHSSAVRTNRYRVTQVQL